MISFLRLVPDWLQSEGTLREGTCWGGKLLRPKASAERCRGKGWASLSLCSWDVQLLRSLARGRENDYY